MPLPAAWRVAGTRRTASPRRPGVHSGLRPALATVRELENNLGVVGGHTSQAGNWKTTSVWVAGTHHRQGAGKRPRCGWRAHITGRRLPGLPFPWSKFTSLTLADEGMVVPGQLFTPLEKSPISTPIHSILPPLALTFHHPYGLYLPNSAGKFPKVKGFGSSFSSIIKPCSYQLHWI